MPGTDRAVAAPGAAARFEGTGEGVAKSYELSGGFSIAAEAIGIQQDTSSNRVRLDRRSQLAASQAGPEADRC